MKRWVGLLFVLVVGIAAAAQQSASPPESLPPKSTRRPKPL